eukprot:GHUV01020411.1.p1 GENE.GHUV01020411.1~~GHUV01020411.1.p1  ORF type:complete len:151 (+),score=32.72 GHUV01020411.1:69-521(+)
MALMLSRSASSLSTVRRSSSQTFKVISGVVAPPRTLLCSPLRPARSVLVKAEGEDFDALLNKMADKFEKTENKPIVIAYVAAAVFAFFAAEWLIHLPALDILLGFPVQLVGLLALPYLSVRWFVDGEDAGKDIEEYAGKIVSKLPGLEKK